MQIRTGLKYPTLNCFGIARKISQTVDLNRRSSHVNTSTGPLIYCLSQYKYDHIKKLKV